MVSFVGCCLGWCLMVSWVFVVGLVVGNYLVRNLSLLLGICVWFVVSCSRLVFGWNLVSYCLVNCCRWKLFCVFSGGCFGWFMMICRLLMCVLFKGSIG